MLILLPPSEGKARPEAGGPVDLDSLAFAAELREQREALPDEEGELILDMRSGAYTVAWKPKRATPLAVRVFTEEDGERKAVSHMAKAVRGDVARALLTAREPSADPEGVAALAEAAGFTVELSDGSLDVIV
ncbi:MAG TPA: peroxide stress protein YaaA [Solirubrobacterales bacterium]|nr:peroxide stress protein YaaA [Solirubrobacterales bacterium]